MRYLLCFLFFIFAVSCSAQEPSQLPSLKDVLERLEKNDESNFRALDVIREELSKARADREAVRRELEELRSVLGGSSSRISGLAESLGLFQKALDSSREELIARTGPLASLLTSLSERIELRAAESEARHRGLLEAFSEARAELVRARAEAQKQYAEAEKMRAEAQRELLAARGTLGSRLFWFSVSVTGSLVVLLIGLSIIIAVVNKLAGKIAAVLALVKPI